MKCVILAGGWGERLWPLSRRNSPKQFIQIRKNHSIFQETIARNIPYCDEFLILTSMEYQYQVENQMAVFQGVSYRCVFETEPHGTAAAILSACLELQSSELVFVAASDQMIDVGHAAGDSGARYADAILEAKQLASEGHIVLFGTPSDSPDPRFGWIGHRGDAVTFFLDRPAQTPVPDGASDSSVLENTGLMVFENYTMQKMLEDGAPELYRACVRARSRRELRGSNIVYPAGSLGPAAFGSVEAVLTAFPDQMRVIICGFSWIDIGKLEDLERTDYTGEGPVVMHKTRAVRVFNHAPDQAVVVNGAERLLVVNMPDAVYIGSYGASPVLNEILSDHEQLAPYAEAGTVFYRPWGSYEQLARSQNHWIRRVTLNPGKTIYAHTHQRRSEDWTIVQGRVAVTLDGVLSHHTVSEHIHVSAGVLHQISNVDLEPAVFVETACGEIADGRADTISGNAKDLAESDLGIASDPFVKLLPVFRDSLWGGTKLRTVFGKRCEYDTAAESWELSAHPAGQSIVADGRHRGLGFGDYLGTVGGDILGWKCRSLESFPILVKWIDARENLSVQVHPDDDYALKWEHQYGKNEMWYVADCDENARLYVGFRRDVSREEVLRRIEDGTVLELLNAYTTHPGDVFMIPAGTVHAIGAGNLICEIQQSSDCTYRLYDYGRKDKFGKQRTLHLDRAMDVLNLRRYEPQQWLAPDSPDGAEVCRCKFFETRIYSVRDALVLPGLESSFQALVCLEGEGELEMCAKTAKLSPGDTVFIRADASPIRLTGVKKVMTVHI